MFLKDSRARGYVTMKYWIREYNRVDVLSFMKTYDKKQQQDYFQGTDLVKKRASALGNRLHAY